MDTFSHHNFKILRDKRMNTCSLAALHNIFPDQVINYLSSVPPPIHPIWCLMTVVCGDASKTVYNNHIHKTCAYA